MLVIRVFVYIFVVVVGCTLYIVGDWTVSVKVLLFSLQCPMICGGLKVRLPSVMSLSRFKNPAN